MLHGALPVVDTAFDRVARPTLRKRPLHQVGNGPRHVGLAPLEQDADRLVRARVDGALILLRAEISPDAVEALRRVLVGPEVEVRAKRGEKIVRPVSGLLVHISAAVEPAQKPFPRLRRLLAALLRVRIPLRAAVPVAEMSVDDAAEGAVKRPAAALVAPLYVVLLHAGEHHLVEAGEVARDEAYDHHEVVRTVPGVAVVRRVAVVENPHPAVERLVVAALAPAPPPLRVERVRHERVAVVRLVRDELVDRAEALFLLAKRQMARRKAELRGYHDPGDVRMELHELAVELQRLVRVVRTLAGVGLHENRVRDKRLVEVLRLGLYLHLAPLGDGRAVARNEVGDARAAALGFEGLREDLGRPVYAGAAGEVEFPVDLRGHLPAPAVHRRACGRERQQKKRRRNPCLHVHRRQSSIVNQSSMSLKESDSWSSSPRARRAHSVSG